MRIPRGNNNKNIKSNNNDNNDNNNNEYINDEDLGYMEPEDNMDIVDEIIEKNNEEKLNEIRRNTDLNYINILFDNIINTTILGSDITSVTRSMVVSEAKYLVNILYSFQKFRIATGNKLSQLVKSEVPNKTILYINKGFITLETDMKNILYVFANNHVLGQWPISVIGIGPLITSNLIALIDMEKANSAASIHRHAGIVPGLEWLGKDKARIFVNKVMSEYNDTDQLFYDSELYNSLKTNISVSDEIDDYKEADMDKVKRVITKLEEESSSNSIKYIHTLLFDEKMKLRPGRTWQLFKQHNISDREGAIKFLSKLPWDPNSKLLAFKLGSTFIKQQNNENSLYARLFIQKKDYYTIKNDRGEYADRATYILANKRFGRNTEAYRAYSNGKLPKGHIHAMAIRWIAMLFLSHYFEISYVLYHGKAPPKPYALNILNHKDYIPPEGMKSWEDVLNYPNVLRDRGFKLPIKDYMIENRFNNPDNDGSIDDNTIKTKKKTKSKLENNNIDQENIKDKKDKDKKIKKEKKEKK